MKLFNSRFSLLVYLNNQLFTFLYRSVRRNYFLWYWVARNYSPLLSKLAYFNACSICDWATFKVPAYIKFIHEKNSKIKYWDFDLTQYPETSKDEYIKKYSFADRCKFGKIPLKWTTIDESSGSTGKAYNWIRTMDELRDVHTVSSNYIRMEIKEEKIITLNAFSMGSWATGLNMTLGLLPISVVKSIGPDIEKIIDTLQTFKSTKEGGYSYIICGYPPFMKHLVEKMKEINFPFEDYRLYAIVGGEGLTEAMRDYLQNYFIKVRSGYGATDIQLGVGGETDFTIWARKLLLKDANFRAKLLGEKENRTPMLFHYNPLDHFIETNDKNEVIISINSFKILSPRLRYNLGDEGKTYEYKEFIKILQSCGYSQDLINKISLDNPIKMPLLLLYGRKDGTISYMGANIYPQDVEQGLYNSKYANLIENFILSLDENSSLESQFAINIELKPDVIPPKDFTQNLAQSVRDYMATVNRDFKESLEEDEAAGQVNIKVFEAGTGIFVKKEDKKIKNKYILEG